MYLDESLAFYFILCSIHKLTVLSECYHIIDERNQHVLSVIKSGPYPSGRQLCQASVMRVELSLVSSRRRLVVWKVLLVVFLVTESVYFSLVTQCTVSHSHMIAEFLLYTSVENAIG